MFAHRFVACIARGFLGVGSAQCDDAIEDIEEDLEDLVDRDEVSEIIDSGEDAKEASFIVEVLETVVDVGNGVNFGASGCH